MDCWRLMKLPISLIVKRFAFEQLLEAARA